MKKIIISALRFLFSGGVVVFNLTLGGMFFIEKSSANYSRHAVHSSKGCSSPEECLSFVKTIGSFSDRFRFNDEQLTTLTQLKNQLEDKKNRFSKIRTESSFSLTRFFSIYNYYLKFINHILKGESPGNYRREIFVTQAKWMRAQIKKAFRKYNKGLSKGKDVMNRDHFDFIKKFDDSLNRISLQKDLTYHEVTLLYINFNYVDSFFDLYFYGSKDSKGGDLFFEGELNILNSNYLYYFTSKNLNVPDLVFARAFDYVLPVRSSELAAPQQFVTSSQTFLFDLDLAQNRFNQDPIAQKENPNLKTREEVFIQHLQGTLKQLSFLEHFLVFLKNPRLDDMDRETIVLMLYSFIYAERGLGLLKIDNKGQVVESKGELVRDYASEGLSPKQLLQLIQDNFNFSLDYGFYWIDVLGLNKAPLWYQYLNKGEIPGLISKNKQKMAAQKVNAAYKLFLEFLKSYLGKPWVTYSDGE